MPVDGLVTDRLFVAGPMWEMTMDDGIGDLLAAEASKYVVHPDPDLARRVMLAVERRRRQRWRAAILMAFLLILLVPLSFSVWHV